MDRCWVSKSKHKLIPLRVNVRKYAELIHACAVLTCTRYPFWWNDLVINHIINNNRNQILCVQSGQYILQTQVFFHKISIIWIIDWLKNELDCVLSGKPVGLCKRMDNRSHHTTRGAYFPLVIINRNIHFQNTISLSVYIADIRLFETPLPSNSNERQNGMKMLPHASDNFIIL